MNEAETSINQLLNPRIKTRCLPIFGVGQYAACASDAMKQVEMALKALMGDNTLFGKRLINKAFGPGKGLKIRLPLDPDLQEEAKFYFDATRDFYRNYCAHNEKGIDAVTSMRIMIIASELLDMLDASHITLEDVGGVKGLLKSGVFSSRDELKFLLKRIDGCWFPAGDVGSVLEELAEDNYGELQFQALFDLDLVDYKESEVDDDPLDVIGVISLTQLGKETLAEILP